MYYNIKAVLDKIIIYKEYRETIIKYFIYGRAGLLNRTYRY